MGAVSMITIQTSPIAGQKSGTSGLRRKTRDWMASQFLENYTQCIINAIQGADDKRFIIGGDGRFYNTEAIQFILRVPPVGHGHPRGHCARLF